MKKVALIAAGTAIALLLGVVVFAGAISGPEEEPQAMCVGGGPLAVKINSELPESVAGYKRPALERAAAIMAVGEKHQIPARGQMVALMTAMQESTLGDNPSTRLPNKDNDAGIFQQRILHGWYGTLEEVNDPARGAEIFYLGKDVDQPGGAGPAGYHIPGLVDIKDWQTLAPTVAAQRVQRSAYPDAYAKHEGKAREIMSALSGIDVTVGDAASCGQDGPPGDGAPKAAPGTTAAIVQFGTQYVGTKYLFGGGDKNGPESGGWDCSALTSYAYFKGAGTTIPRSAKAQNAKYKANTVPTSDLQPGDLLFYAYGRLGGEIDHVGMYIGDGKMVEASNSKGTTLIREARTEKNDSGFVRAVRPPTSAPPA